MDVRGGCCIARFAGAAHSSAYDMSKIDRIMLRFRPIAPKPATTTNPTGSTAESTANDQAKVVPGGRGRRKGGSSGGGGVRRGNNGKKRKSSSPVKDNNQGVVTLLSLLPEAPDLIPTDHGQEQTPSFDHGQQQAGGEESVDPTVMMTAGVVESMVIVEGITDTWTDDIMERNMMRRLDEDTCPGFVSDGCWNSSRVLWTNEAYRRMVMGEQDSDTWQDLKMEVSVVMREKVPETLEAFTCRVRVQQSCDGKVSRGSILTFPCDVWRIKGGGFAWRLDVQAALSLGR